MLLVKRAAVSVTQLHRPHHVRFNAAGIGAAGLGPLASAGTERGRHADRTKQRSTSVSTPPQPMVHPRLNDHGLAVTIRRPSRATSAQTWADASAVATWTPGSPAPQRLNGCALSAWKPPTDVAGWRAVAGQNDAVAAQDAGRPLAKTGAGSAKRPSAGVLIVEPDGRIWLVHPTNQFGGYVATFPKGSLEPGMSLQQTAIREAFEESGLHVRIIAWLDDVERSTSLARFYVAERVAGTPADMGWETQAVSLAPLDAAESILTASVDKALLAALRRWSV